MAEALGISLKEFVFYLINFAILVGVLGFFLYKPFLRTLDQRKQTIREALESAEAANRRADEKMDNYTRKIAGAENEGREIIRKARSRADNEAKAIIEEANTKASRIITDAQEEIQRDRVKAMEDLKGEIGELAMMAAARILEEDIRINDRQDAIIEEVIQEASEGKWNS